ncbi:hypothetical protein FB451DRAFT_1179021 [Mycena latifolia]|nr:hypothetical protein FB451DRAFT_1179021 [Mycena latifolia]
MFLRALLLQVPLVLSLFHAFFVSSPESFSVSEAISWCGGDLTSIIACATSLSSKQHTYLQEHKDQTSWTSDRGWQTRLSGPLSGTFGFLFLPLYSLKCADPISFTLKCKCTSLIPVDGFDPPPRIRYTPGQVLVIGSREKEISTVMLGDFIRV